MKNNDYISLKQYNRNLKDMNINTGECMVIQIDKKYDNININFLFDVYKLCVNAKYYLNVFNKLISIANNLLLVTSENDTIKKKSKSNNSVVKRF